MPEQRERSGLGGQPDRLQIQVQPGFSTPSSAEIATPAQISST